MIHYRLSESAKAQVNTKEELKKKDTQISDMTRQMTFLMKSLEEQKLASDSQNAKLHESEKEMSELRTLLQQQKEVIRQHESTIRDFHQRTISASNEAVSKWGELQGKYEEVFVAMIKT